MSDIQFNVGVFQEFQVRVAFHLGRLSFGLKSGNVVQFDGSTMKVDGVAYSYPELRSAIKADWLAPVGTNVGHYVAKSANVKVRGAQAGAPPASTTVQRDETFVAPAIRKPAATTTDGVRMESKPFNPSVVKDSEGDGRTVGGTFTQRATPAARQNQNRQASESTASEGVVVGRLSTKVNTTFTMGDSTSMPDLGDTRASRGTEVEAQGGQVVGGIKSPTKRKATVVDSNSATREINKLDSTPRTAAKAKPDVVVVPGEDLNEVVEAAELVREQAKAIADARRAERLAAVAKSEGTPAAVLPTPPAPKSVAEALTNGDDVEIAPGLHWSKKMHWRIRVKIALQHKDNPEYLKAILAHEVPSVVRVINESLSV